MPKTQTVTLRYRASEAFWEIQCRAICELSICERRAYSLPSLLAHVAEKKLGELGKLTPKDLLYFASTDSVCVDIPINIGEDKWVNDRPQYGRAACRERVGKKEEIEGVA